MRFKFRSFFQLSFIWLVILAMAGCENNPTAGQSNSSFGEAPNGLTRLNEVTSLLLIDPVTTPNLDDTPTLRLSGLKSTDTVFIYSDANCTSLVTSALSTGDRLDVTLPSLAVGTYSFYAKRRWQAYGIESNCSSVFLNYEVLNSFDPTSINNLQVWLDASDQDSLFQDPLCMTAATANNDSVSCWQDKSGNSNDATMSTPSQAPRLNLVTNSSSIQFDGTDDLFDNLHSYTARTVYVVYRIDSILQQGTDLGQVWGQYTVGHISLDARSPNTWSFDGNAGQNTFYSVAGNALTGPVTNSGAQPWAYNQFDMVRSEYTSDLAITQQVIGSLFPSFPIGTHQYGGQISEIIVYSTTLSAADNQKIEGYLACKWSLQSTLPGGHPFKSSCP